MAPRLADTGSFSAEYGDFIGADAAWVDGPFSLQGEYDHAFIEGRNRWDGNPNCWAASIQASYFLTGEHRPYKTSTGTFGGSGRSETLVKTVDQALENLRPGFPTSISTMMVSRVGVFET